MLSFPTALKIAIFLIVFSTFIIRSLPLNLSNYQKCLSRYKCSLSASSTSSPTIRFFPKSYYKNLDIDATTLYGGYNDAQRLAIIPARKQLSQDVYENSGSEEDDTRLSLFSALFIRFLVKPEEPCCIFEENILQFLGQEFQVSNQEVGDILFYEAGAIALLPSTCAQRFHDINISPAVQDTYSVQHVYSVPMNRSVQASLKRFTREKEIVSIEESVRLDAVASAGMSLSRSQMTKKISQGLVRMLTPPSSSTAAPSSSRKTVSAAAVSSSIISLSKPTSVSTLIQRSGSATTRTGTILDVQEVGRCIVQDIETTSKDRFKITMRRIKFPAIN